MRSAVEAGRAIADALGGAGVPYALGGALALGVAGVPRGTLDVDVNVFVEQDAVRGVALTLAKLGMRIDPDQAAAAAARDGMFVAVWDGMRVDVFVPSIPFSWEAAQTRRQVEVDGWCGWFLAAEAIAVYKLLFFRGKDVVDLERLVAVRAGELDTGYIRRWIVEMMGEDDPRVARFDGLVARFS